jgi:precorrin-8X/cobalt-precorrin-8 methylmutase
MDKIILVGHGSPKKDANQLNIVSKMLHEAMHPDCTEDCVSSAYLEFQAPGIKEQLLKLVGDGATRIIIHPYFLSSGVHVTRDIPGIIEEVKLEAPNVELVYTDPLGVSSRLIQLVIDRIGESCGLAPHEIETESFNVLSEEADLSGIDEAFHPIVKRVIHTTADFSFANSLIFHPDALEAGLKAVRAGKKILTDVEMVRAGINKKGLAKYGGEAVCHLSEVSDKHQGTRTAAAIEAALDDSVGIVAIGNAPTALIKCIEMINEGKANPALVVGVPVGFVRAVESKAQLAVQKFPHITVAGRKGGSPVAAAIVNAIIKLAVEADA